jgi:paired amphipathic helix protein Sin3a
MARLKGQCCSLEFTHMPHLYVKSYLWLSMHPSRDKMLSKPISEVAAEYNPDDRCTPSYVRVPASYPKVKSSGKTAIGDEVLNDSWVSIISGSEDYSFKVG